MAITEEGDAAVSSDSIGGLRLWPTLDGKEEPRVIAGGAVRQLAIAHVDQELVVAIVDAANGLELHRFGPDGVAHGRADVAPEPEVAQLVALGDGVLALGRDQVVRRYAATGALSFALAAEPGARITALAARRGGAIASFDAGNAPTVVRTIELAPTPHWGPPIALPMAVRAVSLSPSHARVAAVKRASGDGVVLELAPRPHAIGGATLAAPAAATAWSGFVDDDHAVFTTAERLSWWGGMPQPKNVTTVGVETELAVGDRTAAAGERAALALIAPARWWHLGYRDLGRATPTVIGQHVALNFGTGLLWLDARLHALRATPDDPAAPSDQRSPYLALDDHLYVTAHNSRVELQEERSVDLAIADLDSPTVRPLVSSPLLGTVTYDPTTRVLAIQVDGRMTRYALDEHGAMRALPALRVPEAGHLVSLDPGRAHGTIAVVFEPTAAGSYVTTFHDGPADGIEIAPATRTRVDGSLLGVARDGTTFVLHDENRIDVYRDGKAGASIVVSNAQGGSAVSHDGRMFVLVDKDVAAVDATGRERWRRTLWLPLEAVFLDDDREIVVATQGGFVVLDAATGATLATGCGWRFGLYDTAPQGRYRVETACE